MDIKQTSGSAFVVSLTSAAATGAAATAIITAASGIKHYITDISGGSDTSTATLTVQTGSTVLWQIRIGNTAGFSHSFTQPFLGIVGTTVIVTVDGNTMARANIAGYSL